MPSMVGVSEAIDNHVESRESGHRPHLGASQVGKPCLRALVYGFRHALAKKNSGRMLRLFSRGHKEEIHLVAYLRAIGFEVQEFAQRLTWHDGSASYAALEWDDSKPLESGEVEDVSHEHAHVVCAELAGIKLRQWAFSDIGGHHAGSTDGQAMNPSYNLRQFPAIPPDTKFGLEFKTYNAKSFDKLWMAHEVGLQQRRNEYSAVREVKPEHYSQMQEYMHYMGLPFCLYMAVCKNDDRLYDEVVPYDRDEALRCVERARLAISARQLPPRFSNNSTNFTCKFCDYRSVCHFGEPLAKSCRTCKHGIAVTEGVGAEWACGLWNMTIPRDFVPVGCDSWSTITD